MADDEQAATNNAEEQEDNDGDIPAPVTQEEAVPNPDDSQGAVPNPDNSQGAVPNPDNSQETVPNPDNSQEAVPNPDNSQEAVPNPDNSQGAVPNPDNSQAELENEVETNNDDEKEGDDGEAPTPVPQESAVPDSGKSQGPLLSEVDFENSQESIIIPGEDSSGTFSSNPLGASSQPKMEQITEIAETPTKDVDPAHDEFNNSQTLKLAAEAGENSLDSPVTAKFYIKPTSQTVTIACALGQDIMELLEYFSNELRIPQNVLLITHDNKDVPRDIKLNDLGVTPNGTIEFELNTSDPSRFPVHHVQQPDSEMHIPDVITVKVPQDDGTYQDVVVEIIRPECRKPYLGGYRNKQSGVEFHNASCQTVPKARVTAKQAEMEEENRRKKKDVELFCRDTQTYKVLSKPIQTTHDSSTQMTTPGIYVSNATDKLISPRPYVTADETLANKIRKVIIIQKYLRRWLAVRYVKKVRNDFQERLAYEKYKEEQRIVAKEQRLKEEYDRRMNPKTKEDFDLLYQYFERWRQEETANINANLKGAERKAALAHLLDQETHILAGIQRHKINAQTDGKETLTKKLLAQAASPLTWKGPNGSQLSMDTPYTIRARELMDIYNALGMRYVTQDERLDVLLTLKHTVKEYDTKLTRDILDLVDREADLLMRGIKSESLEGLRKRISTLFLQFIKIPTFNPEISRYLKVPADPSILKNNIYYCGACNRYLRSNDFPTNTTSSCVGRCRDCIRLDNIARTRQDLSFYKAMLDELQKDEVAELKSQASDEEAQAKSVVFLMKDSDLRFLVEQIWGAQSALSGWTDVYDLTLARWNPNNPWSPWNCVLLTREEADAHIKVESINEAYGKIFKHKVSAKQALARTHFSRLHLMTEEAIKQAASSSQGPANDTSPARNTDSSMQVGLSRESRAPTSVPA